MEGTPALTYDLQKRHNDLSNENKKQSESHMITVNSDCFLIGVTGFEPAASWSRTKHSTGLSHTPIA